MRPAPSPRPKSSSSSRTTSGLDARASFERALEAAETALEAAGERLSELSRAAEETRQELADLVENLRETARGFRTDSDVVIPEVEPVETTELRPPRLPSKAATPQAPREPFRPAKRATSPLEETSAMPPIPAPMEPPAPSPAEETTIRFFCEMCGCKLSSPERYSGKSAACKCGARSIVPEKSTRERGKA